MTKGVHSTQQANTPLPTSGIRAPRVPKPPDVCSLRWLRGTVSLEPTFWRSAGFNESEYSVQETRCSFVCDRRVMVIGTFPSMRLCITSVTNWRGWAMLRPSSTLIYVATIAKGSSITINVHFKAANHCYAWGHRCQHRRCQFLWKLPRPKVKDGKRKIDRTLKICKRKISIIFFKIIKYIFAFLWYDYPHKNTTNHFQSST